MSAMPASNSEVFCAGTVGVIKDLMQSSKSEIYSDFSGCEIIYFIFGSACPISVFRMYFRMCFRQLCYSSRGSSTVGGLESVRDIKAVTALWVGCTCTSHSCKAGIPGKA